MAVAFAAPFFVMQGPPPDAPKAPEAPRVWALDQDTSHTSRNVTVWVRTLPIQWSNHAKSHVPHSPWVDAPPAIAGLAPERNPYRISRGLDPSFPMTRLVSLASAPFPYQGRVPRTGRPFLNYKSRGRIGRKTRSGRVYWADRTYSDRSVLLHIPKDYDAERPGVMVVFFHGHGATLERDVAKRQQVPQQITESGMNAVLVAPQFAVDARDSSAGKFWQPGGVRRFLDEVAGQLATLYGEPGSEKTFADMPVVIVGYSGGYLPTAWALAKGGIEERVKGVVLLDGLYGEVSKFARWIEQDKDGFFVSAYARSTRRGNAELRRILRERKVPYATALRGTLRRDSVTFISADTRHRDYVTRAWANYPIADLLRRMPGAEPRAKPALSASLAPSLWR